MELTYDPTLKEHLSVTNQDSDIILNSFFKDWEEHMLENYKSLRHTYRYAYGREKDSQLYDLCEAHAKKYETIENTENILILGHPLHLQLNDMHELDTEQKKADAKDYLNNLMNLLNMKRDKSKTSVILMETAFHYASATSLWLEKGLVDKVMFTLFNLGDLMNFKEVKPYRGKNLFFGGAYNFKCLESVIYNFVGWTPSETAWGINDIIINTPLSSSLKSNKVENILDKNVIGMDEAIKKLGFF